MALTILVQGRHDRLRYLLARLPDWILGQMRIALSRGRLCMTQQLPHEQQR